MNPFVKHVLRVLDRHENKIYKMTQRIDGIDIRTGIALRCAVGACVILYAQHREIEALREGFFELKKYVYEGDCEANA